MFCSRKCPAYFVSWLFTKKIPPCSNKVHLRIFNFTAQGLLYGTEGAVWTVYSTMHLPPAWEYARLTYSAWRTQASSPPPPPSFVGNSSSLDLGDIFYGDHIFGDIWEIIKVSDDKIGRAIYPRYPDSQLPSPPLPPKEGPAGQTKPIKYLSYDTIKHRKKPQYIHLPIFTWVFNLELSY